MKTQSTLYVAIAAMFIAASAYGQYPYQPTQPQMGHPMMQNRGMQQPMMKRSVMQNAGFANAMNRGMINRQDAAAQNAQPQATAQPQIVQPQAANMAPMAGVGCDAACGPGGACDSACCGMAGCGGRCGGRLGLGGRLGGRGGNQFGGYDPCCPTRYFSVFGGASIFEDIDLNLDVAVPGGPADSLDAILEHNDGWAIGGAVGRTFGRRLRGEFEFAYRNAALDTAAIAVQGQPPLAIGLDGQTNIYSFMPNLLFDLNPGGRLNLYGGVGAGVAFIDLDANETTTPVDVRLQTSSFAYQGIAGISTCLTQRTDLFFEYRYFGTDKLEIDAAAPIGSASADVDITANNLFLGFRIKR